MDASKKELSRSLKKIANARKDNNEIEELFYIGIFLGLLRVTRLHSSDVGFYDEEVRFEEKAKTLLEKSKKEKNVSSVPLKVHSYKDIKQTFDCVVGNSKLVSTLKNMIEGKHKKVIKVIFGNNFSQLCCYLGLQIQHLSVILHQE